jgi:predicted transport protein
MNIYQLHNHSLTIVEEKPFKLEKETQRLFEGNLKVLMGLTLVRSEFTIKNKRIDTLAYDEQTNAFIIIEYKRDRNISVVDQGFMYLGLMLENKADFIVEYNEKLKKNLQRTAVDWTQTRVAFVSPSFTENQVLATNFKDIAIELWEVKRYANDTIVVNEVKKSRSAESIKPITQQNTELKRVTDEIVVYTEDQHLVGASESIAELYGRFRSAILSLADGIEIAPQKHYVAFKKVRNIVGLKVQKSTLKLTINAKWGQIDDARQLARDVSEVGHHSTGDYQIQVSSDKDLEYIMSLIKQVLSIRN